MQQEESKPFPSLGEVLTSGLQGFPRQALMKESPETVRQNLWRLVEEEKLTTTQFMAVWREYSQAKGLKNRNGGSHYYGLSKAQFANLSYEDVKDLSLNGLGNGLENHIKF